MIKTLHTFEYCGKKLGIKKPTRTDTDEADMQFSAYFSDCIKRGILTREMLVREYKNFGGAFSEEENKDYQSILITYFSLQKEIEEEKDLEKLEELKAKQSACFESLHRIQSSQEGLFSKTADIIARDKVLFFLTFLLALREENGEYYPYYVGESHDERYDFFESLIESDDENEHLILDRFAALVSFWYFSDKKSLKEENFKNYESILDSETE
jgi:hypothetical protein